MRKIINGKAYDTETATRLCTYHSTDQCTDFEYYKERLYIKKTGEFFLYGWGNANSKYGEWRGNNGSSNEEITPMTIEEAKRWVSHYEDANVYEEIFGKCEE